MQDSERTAGDKGGDGVVASEVSGAAELGAPPRSWSDEEKALIFSVSVFNQEMSRVCQKLGGNVVNRLRKILLLSVATGLQAMTVPTWAAEETSQPTYSMLIERDIDVPMRDGLQLKADLFRPDSGSEFPVLITLGPYCKDRNDASRAYPIAQDESGRTDRRPDSRSYAASVRRPLV